MIEGLYLSSEVLNIRAQELCANARINLCRLFQNSALQCEEDMYAMLLTMDNIKEEVPALVVYLLVKFLFVDMV